MPRKIDADTLCGALIRDFNRVILQYDLGDMFAPIRFLRSYVSKLEELMPRRTHPRRRQARRRRIAKMEYLRKRGKRGKA